MIGLLAKDQLVGPYMTSIYAVIIVVPVLYELYSSSNLIVSSHSRQWSIKCQVYSLTKVSLDVQNNNTYLEVYTSILVRHKRGSPMTPRY